MDKDRSKKKEDTLWKQVKRSAAKPFQIGKQKNQGKESCKNNNILTFMFHVDIFWRLRTIPSNSYLRGSFRGSLAF